MKSRLMDEEDYKMGKLRLQQTSRIAAKPKNSGNQPLENAVSAQYTF
jgi:hypothetical protein